MLMPGPGESLINTISSHDGDGSDAAGIFKKTLKFP